MHPTVSRVLEYVESNGMERKLFACQVIEYLPHHKQYIQGSGEQRRCNHSWERQVYRILQGKVTPRDSVLQAWEAWLADQLK